MLKVDVLIGASSGIKSLLLSLSSLNSASSTACRMLVSMDFLILHPSPLSKYSSLDLVLLLDELEALEIACGPLADMATIE